MGKVRHQARIRRFKCKTLDTSWAARAARYSLAGSTAGKGVEADTQESIDAVMDLLDRWRARLEQLRLEGWRPVSDKIGLIFLMNCPLVGVTTDQTGLRPCNHSNICPFCWARTYVMGPFNRITHALLDPKSKIDSSLTTVWESYVRVWFNRKDNTPSDIFEGSISRKLENINRCFSSTTGAYSLYSVEPESDNWKLNLRTLLLMPSRKTPPEDVSFVEDGCQVSRSVRVNEGEINHQSLAAILGRIGSYPNSLLTGPSDLVCRILQDKTTKTLNGSRRIYRTADFYGDLRGFKAQVLSKKITGEEIDDGNESEDGAGSAGAVD